MTGLVVVSESPTVAGFTTVVGELPLAGSGGATLYDRIGDAFGWLCCALGLALVAASLWRLSAGVGLARDSTGRPQVHCGSLPRTSGSGT